MPPPSGPQGGAGHAFGSANCPQHISCPGAIGEESNYIAVANACITQFFGYRSDAGFFVDYMGLDGNACLTPIPGVLPKGVGAQMAPTCCVLVQDEQCFVHCDLVTVE